MGITAGCKSTVKMFKGGLIASGPVVDYDAPFNLCVFLCCVAASFGGLLFGYDLGIAGMHFHV